MNTHPIIFAGAGPGDPELITVKAQRAMQAADLIIYTGSLIPEAMLKWARPEARVLSSASMHLTQIIDHMVISYHQGKRVLRLHTGDPSLYGAICEQMAELDRHGVPYTVIPGVSAAFAAAAALTIEFTIPEVCQTLILTRLEGKTPVPDAEALSALAAHKTSMAIYLSIHMVDQVEKVLRAAYGDEAPCAVVYRASQPEEKILVAPLKALSTCVKAADITRQAVILVGKALEVRKAGTKAVSKLYDQTFRHGYRQ